MSTDQKYKNLKYSFHLENIRFEVSSICLERIVKPFPMHSHSSNSFEIHYITSGYGTLNTSEDSYDIVPGTLFVTGPEVKHEQITLPEDPMVEFCIYLKVIDYTGAKRQKNTFLYPFLTRVFRFGQGCSSLHSLMSDILNELSTRKDGFELALQALLQQFVIAVCRLYREETSAASPNRTLSSISDNLPSLLVEEAFLYHFDEITLESLSAMIGLGPRQTERYLMEHYHKTFREKKAEARMSAAITILKNDSSKIATIATVLGYSSVDHFSDAFKRYYGMTPSQMKKKLAEKKK